MTESADFTNINALGAAVALFLGIMLFILPRRYAIIPILIIGTIMTYGQVLNVAGLHFTLLRILIFIGWLRVFIRGEVKSFSLNTIDRIFICWLIAHVSIDILRDQTDATFQMGFAYNAAGLYFLFRLLVRDSDDIEIFIKSLAMIVIPLAFAMMLEYFTQRTLYAMFGGVPEFTVIRGTRLRCQGPFMHPILAGTLGATTIPLAAALAFNRKTRLLAAVCILASLIVVAASASSGPLFAAMGGLVSLFMWKYRAHMKLIRWGILAAAVALHIVMKAPVWYVIGRLSSITGGTGWHRSEIINQAITRIDEWWLMGTSDTSHWMATTLINYRDRADITNQFVVEGIHGGLLTMILFIVLIAYCFKWVGLALQENDAKGEKEFYVCFLPWALGSALFAHTLSFLSVSYFDQTIIYWYSLLAVIAALHRPQKKNYKIPPLSVASVASS